MIPSGGQFLLALRSRGRAIPEGLLWLDSDRNVEPPSWWLRRGHSPVAWWINCPDVVIRRDQPIYRLDLRCFAGMPVTAVAQCRESESRLSQLIDRLLVCGARAVWAARPYRGEDVLTKEAENNARL